MTVWGEGRGTWRNLSYSRGSRQHRCAVQLSLDPLLGPWLWEAGGPDVIGIQVWEAGLGCYWVTKPSQITQDLSDGRGGKEGPVYQGGGYLVQGRWFMAQRLEPSGNEGKGGE